MRIERAPMGVFQQNLRCTALTPISALAGGVGARDGRLVAQLVAERLEVGPLDGRRGVPAADEVGDGGLDLNGRCGIPHFGEGYEYPRRGHFTNAADIKCLQQSQKRRSRPSRRGKAQRRPGLVARICAAMEKWLRSQSVATLKLCPRRGE